jgi:3-phytase
MPASTAQPATKVARVSLRSRSLAAQVLVLALAACGGRTDPPSPGGDGRPSDAPGEASLAPRTGTYEVEALAETDPVPHRGDAADDPAIWVHPSMPEGSLIIGTDKQDGGGLLIYDLEGRQLAFQADGATNNVDLRDDLVVASNEADNRIAIYRLDPDGPRLVRLDSRPITPEITIYGTCLYRSGASGAFYAFVTSRRGEVEQWELSQSDGSSWDGRKVREFRLASQTEACVADDATGTVYLAEEEEGIWAFGAEPEDPVDGVLIDRTGGEGHLEADVEGLAIARDPAGGGGLLIASSQGDDRYEVYTLGDGAHVATFRIVDSDAVDRTSETDGLEVTTASLGGAYTAGMLLVQDGENDAGNQNFKLVPLAALMD